MTTYDKDVLSSMVYDIPKSVMSYRTSARGAGTAEIYVRLMNQPSHLLRLSSSGCPNDSVPTSESEQVVDAFGGTCENLFGGRKIVRSFERLMLDDGLKALPQRKSLNLQRTRCRAWIW